MCATFKQEFHLRNLRLDIPNPEAFACSWWLTPRVFIVYRVILALYTTAWSVIGGFQRQKEGFKWFIFLTNWSYSFLNVHFILGAFVAIYYHYFTKQGPQVLIREESIESAVENEDITPDVKSSRILQLSCKASWVIYTIAANVAFPVTVMFWSLVYIPGQPIDGSTFNAHALNSFLVIVDTLLSCIPVRLLHVVYPMIYTAIYTIFSVIYWACGGTNPDNQPYIYAAIDYGGHPGKAAFFACLFIFIANPLSRLLLFGLYRLRIRISTYRGDISYLRGI